MLPATAFAQKTIKLAHLNKNDPFDNGTGAMAVVFKSLVESGTNGAVKVEIFPDGQLGKDNEVIQQVKSGVVQSSIFIGRRHCLGLSDDRRARRAVRLPEHRGDL